MSDYLERAHYIYGQDRGNIYISPYSFHGLTLAVFPEQDTYVFNVYSAGDEADRAVLRDLMRKDIFKTYACTICPLQDLHSAVIISDEQNQPYLSDHNPIDALNIRFVGVRGTPYILSGTVPQYYYNHLRLTSASHVPTYAIFSDVNLFSDLMTLLASAPAPNLVAYFNGNFGSDVYHFQVSLSDQSNPTLNDIVATANTPDSEVAMYRSDIVRCLVMKHTDLNIHRAMVFDVMVPMLDLRKLDPDLVITANFSFRRGKYFTTVHFTRRNALVWRYRGCAHQLFPPAFMMNVDCFAPPQSPRENQEFLLALQQGLGQTYLDPAQFVTSPQGAYSAHITQIMNTPWTTLVHNLQVEDFYIWIQTNKGRYPRNLPFDLMGELLSITCMTYPNKCNQVQLGMFKYALGLAVNLTDEAVFSEWTQNPQVINLLIGSERFRLYQFNAGKECGECSAGECLPLTRCNVYTDYLYFRGRFVIDLILKTFNNLLTITAVAPDDPLVETSMVNSWIKFTYKRIGEASASGANTASSLVIPGVDMVMKIMKTTKEEKQREFAHEYYASKQVNNIRRLIPNFIAFFGGFFCNTSDITTRLCDQGPGRDYSYLLLENVKNAQTLGRHIRLPGLTYPTEADDFLDGMYQLYVALAFAWRTNRFTHYDLHPDNIMLYDFIANKNYLNLFKVYQEDRGDAIPPIQQILFCYYWSPTEYVLVPAKYLYLIIDYGNAYTDGMPPDSHFQYDFRYQGAGMTSDQPHIITDVYTMTMFILYNVLLFKPHLVIRDGQWIANDLVGLFYKTVQAYGELWLVSPDEVMNAFLTASQARVNRPGVLDTSILDLIKPQYRSATFKHLSKDFPIASVTPDFLGAERVVEWLYTHHYQALNLEQLMRQDNVYVFNWGDIPPDMLMGIQPTPEIVAMHQQKILSKAQHIGVVQEYVERSQQ